jgi:hypothetical protein
LVENYFYYAEDEIMNIQRFFLFATVVMLTAVLGIFGCEQGSPTATDDPAQMVDGKSLLKVSANGTESHTVGLITRRSQSVGSVSFQDVDLDSDGSSDALEVRYVTSDGWTLMNVDLWVGPTLADMPDTRKGDPKPRKFPYHARRIKSNEWSVLVPFEAIGYQCGDASTWYAAAHATVRKNENRKRVAVESAWSGDNRFRDKRGHWATYTTIVIDCENGGPPPPPQPHPAYAYDISSECLSTYGVTPGWTTPIFDSGTYVFVLYADPSDCDISGLTAVGTVTLEYDGVSNATVSFALSPPYTMSLAAVYYSDTQSAPPSSDPNSYKLVQTLEGAKTQTFTITDFQPFSYFVAQALVDGF